MRIKTEAHIFRFRASNETWHEYRIKPFTSKKAALEYARIQAEDSNNIVFIQWRADGKRHIKEVKPCCK